MRSNRIVMRAAFLGAAALFVGACSGADAPPSDAEGLASNKPATPAQAGPESIDPFPWEVANPVALDGFDPDEIISGGPPPDGIRPIEVDEARFESVGDARDWLAPQSPVLAVTVGSETKAYPLAIMTQHEIVNDVVGGVPVLATYCPLCNSGLAFERTVDDTVLTFGTSGRLYRSNLVMYDRQTRTLWSQFTGTGVLARDNSGYVGTELTQLPTQLVGFGQLATSFPDALVLSEQTFPSRDYGRNPYVGYDGDRNGFLYRGPDTRPGLPPNARVLGVGSGDDALAISLDRMQNDPVVAFLIDNVQYAALWAPGQASALDTASINDGQDVGSTGVFVAPSGGITPHPDDPQLFIGRDSQTWDVLGKPQGDHAALEPVPHEDTFWFVWFAFQPDTGIA